VTAPTVDTWAVVARAQGGDPDAVAELYRQYHDTVFRYVQFRVPNRATAEDVAQDTWVKALRNIGTISYQGVDFAAWLVTIARNLVNDHFKAARHRYTSARTLDDLVAERFDPVAADDPEAETVHAIQTRAAALLVGPLLRELTPDQQAVIRLRFFDGLSTNEAAAVMGKQVGAVKAAQTRACASLRRQLAEVSA
jgi:RNA polymerase sigma-70 factor, ECF subfamily